MIDLNSKNTKIMQFSHFWMKRDMEILELFLRENVYAVTVSKMGAWRVLSPPHVSLTSYPWVKWDLFDKPSTWFSYNSHTSNERHGLNTWDWTNLKYIQNLYSAIHLEGSQRYWTGGTSCIILKYKKRSINWRNIQIVYLTQRKYLRDTSWQSRSSNLFYLFLHHSSSLSITLVIGDLRTEPGQHWRLRLPNWFPCNWITGCLCG